MCYTPESKLILKGNYFNEKKKKLYIFRILKRKLKQRFLRGVDPLQDLVVGFRN